MDEREEIIQILDVSHQFSDWKQEAADRLIALFPSEAEIVRRAVEKTNFRNFAYYANRNDPSLALSGSVAERVLRAFADLLDPKPPGNAEPPPESEFVKHAVSRMNSEKAWQTAPCSPAIRSILHALGDVASRERMAHLEARVSELEARIARHTEMP